MFSAVVVLARLTDRIVILCIRLKTQHASVEYLLVGVQGCTAYFNILEQL